LRKKVLESVVGKSLEDGLADARTVFQQADMRVSEAMSEAEALDLPIVEAQCEFEQVGKDVAAAIEHEVQMAGQYLVKRRRTLEFNRKKDEVRLTVLDAQKKLALLEMLAANREHMEQLEAKRRLAVEAAKAAQDALAAERHLAKKAFDEALCSLEDRGTVGSRGIKRSPVQGTPKCEHESAEQDLVESKDVCVDAM